MEHDRQMLHDFFLEDEVDEEEEEEFEDLGLSSNEFTEPIAKYSNTSKQDPLLASK